MNGYSLIMSFWNRVHSYRKWIMNSKGSACFFVHSVCLFFSTNCGSLLGYRHWVQILWKYLLSRWVASWNSVTEPQHYEDEYGIVLRCSHCSQLYFWAGPRILVRALDWILECSTKHSHRHLKPYCSMWKCISFSYIPFLQYYNTFPLEPIVHYSAWLKQI